MNYSRPLSFGLALLASLVSQLTAQPTSSPAASTPGTSQNEETVELRPFEVVADSDDRYEAINFNSLTGTNRSLERLPISAEIITAALMEDLGTTDVVSLLSDYATGIGPSEAGGGSPDAAGTQAGDRGTMDRFAIRGLNSGAIRRNGFLLWGTSSEGFSADRVEIVRGPQALLYGPNPAGGIINIATKKANFGRNFYRLQARVDSEGSERFVFDANIHSTVLGRKVAFRASLLEEDAEFYRLNVGRETRGQYGEVAIELFPATSTTLRLEFENRLTEQIDARGGTTVIGIPSIVPNNTRLSLLLARNDPALAQIANGFVTWDNVDSFAGTSWQTRRHEKYASLTLSSQIRPWLSTQLILAAAPFYVDRNSPAAFQNLRAPRANGNPLDAWATAYRPNGTLNKNRREGGRFVVNMDFDLTRHTKNNLVLGIERQRFEATTFTYQYFEADADGNVIIFRPNETDTNNRGRNIMPLQWVDVRQNIAGFVVPRQKVYNINGVNYAFDLLKSPNPALATDSNPFGFNNGPGGASIFEKPDDKGYFGALFTTWMDGKLETLLAARYDSVASNTLSTNEFSSDSAWSGNVGAVWNASRHGSLYAAWSSNFREGSQIGGFGLDGGPLPVGRGVGKEVGIKLNAFEGRLSGSLAAYETDSQNESQVMSGLLRDATDPSGVNGRNNPLGPPTLTFDRVSRGVELTLTARPTKDWRLQFGYTRTDGRDDGDVILQINYNDEFRTNAQGQVILADGTPLLVPVNPAIAIANDGKTYAPGVATQAMTVNILRNGDANGNYQAILDPDNGRITNLSGVGLNVSGVGTGRTGLPLSAHQLGFVSPVGETLVGLAGGDRTIGYPRDSFTLTSMYTFSSGPFKGFGVGVNASLAQNMVLYYYTDATDGSRRALKAPDRKSINLIFSYSRKFGKRFGWKSQININNIADDRYLMEYPSITTGEIQNAGYRVNPRLVVWTNTLSF